MSRIRFPMGCFATAGNNNTGPKAIGILRRNGRRQMHQERDRTNHTIGVIHKPYQLPQRCFAAQVQRTNEFWVKVALPSDLHKPDPASEVVDYPLKSLMGPPFNREIAFAA